MPSCRSSKCTEKGERMRVQDLPPVPSPPAGHDAKLKAACQEMEAVFLNILLQRMRATVPKTDLTGNSSRTETMQGLLDAELTKNMASAGGIGLADMLYRQLSATASFNNSRAPK